VDFGENSRLKAVPLIIPHIVSQHAEEASFLWTLRSTAVCQHRYDLNDLAGLDERIEAHLDGLRIAGSDGVKFYQEPADGGEFFTAALMAIEMDKGDFLEMLLAAACADPALSRAVVSALGWLPRGKVEPYVRPLLNSDSTSLRRIGISACAVQRVDPGALLAAALESSDLQLRERALRAVGELGRKDLLPVVLTSLVNDDDAIRFAACWTATLLGHRQAADGLCRFIGSMWQEKALNLALRVMDREVASQLVSKLAGHEETQRLAIRAAGIVGDTGAIPFLFEMMQLPEQARPAGEAFFLITGCDIEKEDLWGTRPENFTAGPSDEADEEDVAMDPDEELPWPDPELVAAWWDKHKVEFRRGERLLLGKPLNQDHLQHVLRSGFQMQRLAAALELVLLGRGRSLFEVRAPGLRQKQLLA